MRNEFGELIDEDVKEEIPTEPAEPELPDDDIDPPPEDVDTTPEEPEESEEMKILKIRLREADYPLFTDEELQYFIDESKDLDYATYKAALLKSEANGLTLNGIEIESMSRFFLRIAAMYRPTNSGDLL